MQFAKAKLDVGTDMEQQTWSHFDAYMRGIVSCHHYPGSDQSVATLLTLW